MKRFRKLVVLDRLVLTEHQWAALRSSADEVVEFSGLRPDEVVQELAREQKLDAGAVCFTALAIQQATEEELMRRLAGADAVITCWTNIPDEVLRSNPQIRYVGFWTNLASHRINMRLAEEMGIRVTHIPDYGTNAVAEWTFAVLLELARGAAQQAAKTLQGSWVYELIKRALYIPDPSGVPYFHLRGRKLGLIGFGRIGQAVAEIALGFGMEVSYWSRQRRPEWEARGVVYAEVDDLLQSSDVVSLHLSPYANVGADGRISIDDHAPDCPERDGEEAAPVITRSRLASLRDGAIFVNTSAGRLVDEEALLEEAESGRIRIAADVWRSSPDRKRLKRIESRHGKGYHCFTYRGGWFTRDAITFKGEELVRQLREFLGE